jgi:hypothetical protein
MPVARPPETRIQTKSSSATCPNLFKTKLAWSCVTRPDQVPKPTCRNAKGPHTHIGWYLPTSRGLTLSSQSVNQYIAIVAVEKSATRASRDTQLHDDTIVLTTRRSLLPSVTQQLQVQFARLTCPRNLHGVHWAHAAFGYTRGRVSPQFGAAWRDHQKSTDRWRKTHSGLRVRDR